MGCSRVFHDWNEAVPRTRQAVRRHPNAAALDIGATLHVAAVGLDRAPEPVRTFGTFTGDVHRRAEWLERGGVQTVAMASTGVSWIPAYESLEHRGVRGAAGQRPRCQARSAATDRGQRRSMAAAPT